MDNFPQFPPRDDDDAELMSQAGELLAWAGIITAVWVLTLIGVIYVIAGGGPSFASYMHGVLLGILIGAVLVVSVVTRKLSPRRRA